MAGEEMVVQGGESTQVEQAQDFFSAFEPEDPELFGGDPVEDDDEKSPKEAKQLEEKRTSSQKPAKPGEEKKPDEGDESKPAIKPEGLYAQWYKDGENGEKVFDQQAAVKWLLSAPEYKHQGRQFAQPKAQSPSQTAPADPFDAAYEKHHQTMESRKAEVYLWKTEFAKALQTTKDGDAAAAIADAAVERRLGKEFSQLQRDFDKQWRYGQQSEFEKERVFRELQGQARTNERRVIDAHFGGDPKRFANAVTEFAADEINALYDAMNPDAKKGHVTAEEHRKGFERWYVSSVASDPGMLSMLVSIVRAKAMAAALPQLLANARAEAQAEAMRGREGRRRAPGMHATPRAGAESGDSTLSRYLNGPDVVVDV